jgi:hypothetical protein
LNKQLTYILLTHIQKGQEMKKILAITCFLVVIVLSGCGSDLLLINVSPQAESVMTKRDRVVASTDYGTLTITAGQGNKRYITLSGNAPRTTGWMGDTVLIKLAKRRSRYRGTLELYSNSSVKELRQKNAGGIDKVEMEEAQLHFDTLDAAKKWLGVITYDKGFSPRAWTNNGLYVRCSFYTPESWFFPKPTILHVQIFQIYIGGRKPASLPDSQNDKIKVEHITDEQLQNLKKSISWF